MIGKSCYGNDIKALKIGDASAYCLIAAAFHGSERITSTVALMFLENLCRALEKDDYIAGLKARRAIVGRGVIIVPCVNPDGVQIAINGVDGAWKYAENVRKIAASSSEKWNANARGVDINHNFDAGWTVLRNMEIEEGIVGPSPRRYGGYMPESEPETATITRLCRRVPVEMLITFHSQGEEIFYEYGKNTPEKALYIAKIFSALTDYTLVKNEGLYSSGGLKDWFIEEFSRPAFTVEIGKGKNPLPPTQMMPIYAKLREILFTFPILF